MEYSSIVIGITGGIGSGKSTVADIITGLGHTVIKTDDRAKELMIENEQLRTKLINEFGADVYTSDGGLNRKFLADTVFGGLPHHEVALEKLNNIVHPYVIDDMIAQSQQYAMNGEKMIFIESALIFEAGLQDGFDYVVVVDAPEKACIERAVERGMAIEQVKRRMDRQISLGIKKSHADFVIDNSGPAENLRGSVEFVVNVLKGLPPKEERVNS